MEPHSCHTEILLVQLPLSPALQIPIAAWIPPSACIHPDYLADFYSYFVLSITLVMAPIRKREFFNPRYSKKVGYFYDWASQLIFPIRRPDKSKVKLKLLKKRQLLS